MPTALIITDMLNRYEHQDADRLIGSVRKALPTICELLAAARAAGALAVYVNDNHGDWSAGRAELADWALHGAEPSLIEPILPSASSPFVVKARHSVFYGTQLEYLLRHEGVDRVVLAGQVTEQCILYSALDAYVRHFEVVVVADAVAHIHADLAQAALHMMERNMRAEVIRNGLHGLSL
jgi:nicotinamidase-related amidase